MTRAGAAAGEPGSIVLTGGEARLELVPTLGGRVRSLQMGGREWVLADEGWEERAGGEARPVLHEIDLRTDTTGHTLRTVWRGARAPWSLARTLLVRPDGTVDVHYEATATERVRFDWCASLTIPLGKRTSVEWPDASTVTVQVDRGGQTLTVRTAGEPAPHCATQLDREGTRTGRKRGLFSRGPAPAVIVMPALGAAEGVASGVETTECWLAPGGALRWTLTLVVT